MKNGFTFIELMIVMAIIGLIFAIALQLHNKWMEKRDVIDSLSSELAWNYNSLKKIQRKSSTLATSIRSFILSLAK